MNTSELIMELWREPRWTEEITWNKLFSDFAEYVDDNYTLWDILSITAIYDKGEHGYEFLLFDAWIRGVVLPTRDTDVVYGYRLIPGDPDNGIDDEWVMMDDS